METSGSWRDRGRRVRDRARKFYCFYTILYGMTTQKHYREGKSKPHNTLDRYALRRGLTKSDTAEANVFDAEDSSLNGAVAILPDDVFTEESLLTSGHAEPTMKDLLAAIS